MSRTTSNRMVPCEVCGKRVNLQEHICHGCNSVVCTMCAVRPAVLGPHRMSAHLTDRDPKGRQAIVDDDPYDGIDDD